MSEGLQSAPRLRARVVKLPLGCDAEHRTTNLLEPICLVQSAGETRPIPLEADPDPLRRRPMEPSLAHSLLACR